MTSCHCPHVLIVDAERLMRWTLGVALSRRGFVVVEALDMADALTVLAHAPGRFDVIVLEYHARHPVTGRLADVRALAPNARLVVTSSHFDDALQTSLIADGADVIVEKPFGLDVMVDLVAGEDRPVGPRAS